MIERRHIICWHEEGICEFFITTSFNNYNSISFTMLNTLSLRKIKFLGVREEQHFPRCALSRTSPDADNRVPQPHSTSSPDPPSEMSCGTRHLRARQNLL